MAVNEAVLKCVVFLGVKENGQFRPRATGFVVSIQDPDAGIGWHYLVTAEHVIARLRRLGRDVCVRSNLKNGTASVNDFSIDRWWFHPNNATEATDVAVTSADFFAEEDFLSVPLNRDTSMAATDRIMRAGSVGVGHEVYITGLFRSHYGQQQNVPIVRIGNIAMMRGEKVYTKYCGYTDAYLIETRSIGGLSGSPVFINVLFHGRTGNIGLITEDVRTYLLGLMHGHFDIQNVNEDIVVEDGDAETSHGINTGIGVVIPVEKILETLDHPELVNLRSEAIADRRKSKDAT